MRLSPQQLIALREVANGTVRWSASMGSWEPGQGYRRPSTFDSLEAAGLIAIEYDAPREGRVTQTVPVRITVAGRALLQGGVL